MYEKIKLWHEKGWWTDAMVRQAAAKGLIAEEQAKEIVGGVTKNECKFNGCWRCCIGGNNSDCR